MVKYQRIEIGVAMVNLYKSKGDKLTCGSYRGIQLIQLFEHEMKVLKRVIKGRARKIVKIDTCSLELWQAAEA